MKETWVYGEHHVEIWRGRMVLLDFASKEMRTQGSIVIGPAAEWWTRHWLQGAPAELVEAAARAACGRVVQRTSGECCAASNEEVSS